MSLLDLFTELCQVMLFLSTHYLFTELCQLKLRRLDMSDNRISKLPNEYRHLDSLDQLQLQNNPLVSPPAQVKTIQYSAEVSCAHKLYGCMFLCNHHILCVDLLVQISAMTLN